MEEGKKRLVLIDGNAILHRAYHALPPLTTRSGELVNAVYGFASMLLKIFDELHPEYLVVAFDTTKPTFRQQEFVGYQAKRPKMVSELAGQIEKVHDLVRAFNVPIFEVEGYEADDVIGTLAKQATGKILRYKDTKILRKKTKKQKNGKSPNILMSQYLNIEVVIVTGDKDLMQLVNDKVKLYMPSRGLSEGQIVGEEEVKERMGVLPSKIVDYKGLVGDPSDNYPGVPGIGPKTAVKLIERFGSLEEIYRKIGEIGETGGETTIKKLAEGVESAFLSKKLARILTNVPVSLKLEDCVAKDYDREKVLAFFKELGFRSLAGRVGGDGENKGNMGNRENKGERKNEKQQSLF